jgi:excisionase family DNA binding protein
MLAQDQNANGIRQLPRQFLRPSEVVQLTGLSKSTVFAALYSGELKGHRVGRAWLVAVEDVERWVRGSGRTA